MKAVYMVLGPGTFDSVEPKEVTVMTETPSLEKLKADVGGFIEQVPGFDTYLDKPCVAFCNEEGKIHGLKVNHYATNKWRQCIETDDVLVGNVVIIMGDDEFLEAL